MTRNNDLISGSNQAFKISKKTSFRFTRFAAESIHAGITKTSSFPSTGEIASGWIIVAKWFLNAELGESFTSFPLMSFKRSYRLQD